METTALELTNRLRAEAGRVSESGLPLDVFPQQIQKIITLFWRNCITVPTEKKLRLHLALLHFHRMIKRQNI